MISQANGKFLRGSPIKARLVLDLIRGKDVLTSQAILAQVEKGSADKILKVLNSAVASAKQKGLAEEQLIISKITANQGPHWKRFRSAPFGRAMRILKKTMHLSVELDVKIKK
ncbi:MAG: 50S ribosomal protein L22 [Candidatus Omnitrophica bacterium]|nr:50S ribosomal protein L22 [Candidatus Omnitrophota bacterium]